MAPLKYHLEVSNQWDVLGPFPIHAREQHLLSPAFPLNLSVPIDFDKKWPSSYADGGLVQWTKTTKTSEGELQVSFPEVRWKYLRSFEGWAALQHHAVLRTTFKVVPSTVTGLGDAIPKLAVHLHQASYFAVLPKESFSDVTPKWYAGNIYDLPRSTPHIVELPPSTTGEYQLFVSGDYEIRLFGDPTVQEGSEVPVQHIKIDLHLEEVAETVYAREPSQDVVCDFVDGHAFGNSIGVSLRSLAGWVVVEGANTGAVSSNSLDVELSRPIRIAAGQTRVIPLKLLQRSQFKESELDLKLNITAELPSGENVSEDVSIFLQLRHLPAWSDSERRVAIRASYLYASSSPTIFTVLPPLQANAGKDRFPILALHGAGVDVVDLHTELWAGAMPRNDETWIIMPSGRTSWGLDWHGPSSYDAWASVSALSDILQANDAWKEQAFPREMKVVLIGHSNGGQGVWHLATHFPDRVVAAAPAAAYIKSQAYVPLTHSRSAHFVDPMLRAILETSLTPDDNDLHLSNIAHLPLLAVHGGADENVPSWHSRELIGTLHTLSRHSDSTFKEDPGQGHWYSSVLNSSRVQEFVDKHIDLSKLQPARPASFTLTTSNPSEVGSLHGWRIHSLVVPGRLGTLRVAYLPGGLVKVDATNIQRLHSSSLAGVERLSINHQRLSIDPSTELPVTFVLEGGQWSQVSGADEDRGSPPTRLQSILSSQGTIKVSYDSEAAFSVARRLAHDLLTYHRLDVELVAPSDSNSLEGETVVIGTLQSPHIQQMLKREQTGFRLFSGKLYLGDKLVDLSAGQSCIFLHPGAQIGRHAVVVIYTDNASLEQAGRLFPVRTGVAVPSWLCLSPQMNRIGAAGIQAAGIWASDWKLQPESTWWAY